MEMGPVPQPRALPVLRMIALPSQQRYGGARLTPRRRATRSATGPRLTCPAHVEPPAAPSISQAGADLWTAARSGKQILINLLTGYP